MLRYFLLLFSTGLWGSQATLYMQVGHSGNVSSVAFSPDGRFVLTGGSDQTARLWDAASGAELRRFEIDVKAPSSGGNAPPVSVAFSPDGLSVLTGSWDRTARLWNAATGKEVLRFRSDSEDPYGPFPVAFFPDGRLVATGGRTAHLWDAATGAQRRRFDDQLGGIGALAFSPNGRFLLTGTGGNDGTVLLFDAVSGAEIRSFSDHALQIQSVAVSADGRFVLTGDLLGTARLWNLANGMELRRFQVGGLGPVTAALSPDGRFVVSRNMLGGKSGVLRRLAEQISLEAPRRSREMTHFCSLRLTHTKNRFAHGQTSPAAISSTPQACGVLSHHLLTVGRVCLSPVAAAKPGTRTYR